MKPQNDIDYIIDFPWVSFLPNTEDGEDAVREIFNKTQQWKQPVAWLPSIKKQLKAAGYTIGKAKPVSMKQIFAEWDALGWET